MSSERLTPTGTGVPAKVDIDATGRRDWRETRAGAIALGTLGVLIVLGVLELLSLTRVVPPSDIPPPGRIIRSLVSQLGAGAFWVAVGDTLKAWAIGLVIAVVVGVVVGMAMGAVRVLWHALRPTIEFLRPIPSVALIPVVILAYGTGIKSNIFLIAFGATWPVLIQVLYGVRQIDPVARETVRSFGFSRLQQVWRLDLPSILPFLATGLRIGSATALIIAVTAELVIGTAGLGESIALAQSGNAIPMMYALILATGLLGVAIHLITASLERRLLFWHPSQRASSAR